MLITNFGTIPSQGGLMLPNWSYGKEITIPANSIDADLPYFPCPVYLNSSNFDFSKCKADGSDIRFTDKNLNHYKFEKVEYTNANQFAKFTVLIPSVSDLTDTEFYMWYGNPNAYNTSIEAWQDQTGKQLTYNGNVKLVPNVAKFGNAAYFDGADDYIIVDLGSDMISGSEDWTYEEYINPAVAVRHNSCIAIFGDYGSNVGISIWWASDKYYIESTYGGTKTYTYVDSELPKVGKQDHIELSKQGSSVRFFVNGKLGTTLTASGNASISGTKLYLGTTQHLTTYLMSSCYRDEIRYSKGIARHTTNFTPPTEPYTVDQYTKLLLHFDSTPFTDETGKTVTTYGDVKPIKTAYADGARGAVFDGSGDYFNLNGESEFAFGSGNFSMEFTVRFNTTATDQVIYDGRPTSTQGAYIFLAINASGILYFATASDNRIIGTKVLKANTIYKIKLDRYNGITKMYIDGVQEGASYTDTNTYLNGASRPTIGASGYTVGTLGLNGNILGVRITKGRSRNSEVQPDMYTIDASDVVFCTNFDTIYSQDYAMVQHMGDSLVDATGNGNNGTATGTTVVSTDYGKVRQFDGTDDKITTALFTNTDNVTLTVMATKVGTGGTDLLFYVGTSGTNGYGLYTNSLKFSLKAGTTFADTTVNNTTTPQVVTLTRTSGTWTAIIDGISYAVTNLSVTTPTGSTYFGGSTTDFYDGQLSNARYSTVARSAAYTKAEQKALKNTLLTITGA